MADLLGRVRGVRAQLEGSIDSGRGRFDRAVLTATARQRGRLAGLDWQLGIWAGLGDRRTASAEVETVMGEYFEVATARGERYGRVLGIGIGLGLILLALIVAVILVSL